MTFIRHGGHTFNLNDILRTVCEYILMLSIILIGNSVYSKLKDFWLNFEVLIIAIVLCTVLLLIIQKTVYRSDILKAISIASLLLLFLLFNNHRAVQMIIVVILPLFLFIIYLSSQIRAQRIKVLIYRYSNIVLMFASISLVLYVFGTLLNLLPKGVAQYSWGIIDGGAMKKEYATRYATHYFHLMYETQRQLFFGVTFIRNSGIFTEAPVYAVPLVLAMSCELLAREHINKQRVLILLTTIFTTFSTIALVISFTALALKLLIGISQKRNGHIFWSRLIASIFAIACIIFAYMVLAQKESSGSYSSRMLHLDIGIQAFLAHPVFGVGHNNIAGIIEYSPRRLGGLSMGLTTLLAQGGIYIFTIYFGGFLHALYNVDDKMPILMFGIIFTMLLFSSNISWLPTTTFLLALGYAVPTRQRIRVKSSYLHRPRMLLIE